MAQEQACKAASFEYLENILEDLGIDLVLRHADPHQSVFVVTEFWKKLISRSVEDKHLHLVCDEDFAQMLRRTCQQMRYKKNTVDTLKFDLHGFRLLTCRTFLLFLLIRASQDLLPCNRISLITGIGNHSPNGVSVLKPEVISFLRLIGSDRIVMGTSHNQGAIDFCVVLDHEAKNVARSKMGGRVPLLRGNQQPGSILRRITVSDVFRKHGYSPAIISGELMFKIKNKNSSPTKTNKIC